MRASIARGLRKCIFITPLFTLVGCDEPGSDVVTALVSKIEGRVHLPDKIHGEPTVPAEEICKLITVSVGYFYTATTPAPEGSNFTPGIPQFKPVESHDPVGGSYDAAANACTYSLHAVSVAHAHQGPGGAVLMASYELKGSTWSTDVLSIHGKANVTLENGKIAAPNIQLVTEKRVR